MNPAYRQVRFRIDSPGMKLPAAFAIVTAWNPDGLPTALEANKEANDRLRSRLDEGGWQWFPVTGGSLDFAHAEPGFGVVAIARDDAVALGQEFRQEAIFWVKDGVVFLVSCNDPVPEQIGSWGDLVFLGGSQPKSKGSFPGKTRNPLCLCAGDARLSHIPTSQMKEKLEEIIASLADVLRERKTVEVEELYADLGDHLHQRNYDLLLQVMEQRGMIRRTNSSIQWVG